MKSALSGEAEVLARIRQHMQALQRSRAKLVLELTNPATGERYSLDTMIEQVRENDIIISQPSAGAVTRPLASGDRVQLQFASGSGMSTGEARVLGRIKLPSGGKRMFFGYRVSLPTSLRTTDRRQHARIPLTDGEAPIVHLMSRSGGSEESQLALAGQLKDISIGGAQVKLEGESETVQVGSKLTLLADFPSPVGSIMHPVTVARVLHDPNTGETRLGLQFAAPVANLDQFLETLESRRSRRS